MLSSLASPRRLGWITSPLDAGHAFLYATGYELSFAQFFPATTEDNLNSSTLRSKINSGQHDFLKITYQLHINNCNSTELITSVGHKI